MSEATRASMLKTVQQMFSMVKRAPDEATRLDEEGVPTRLKDMAETIFSPDIQFSVPGRGPQAFTGGKDAYYQYNIERMAKTEGKQKLELLDILIGETYAAGLVKYTDERDGESFSWLRANVYRFNEAGDQIVDIKTYEHDQHGVDDWFAASLG